MTTAASLLVTGSVLGMQDSLEEARAFVEDRGTTFTMLWDESFESWVELGVASQPTAVLFTPDGTIITGWVGRFPEDQVLELAAQHTAGCVLLGCLTPSVTAMG